MQFKYTTYIYNILYNIIYCNFVETNIFNSMICLYTILSNANRIIYAIYYTYNYIKQFIYFNIIFSIFYTYIFILYIYIFIFGFSLLANWELNNLE